MRPLLLGLALLLALASLGPVVAQGAVIITQPGVSCTAATAGGDVRLLTPVAGQDYCLDSTVSALKAWNGTRWIESVAGVTFNAQTDFYATGNGTTNDAPFLQAALDAAHTLTKGDILLPCGTYLIQTRLTIYSNTRLHGAGWCAIIKVGASINTAQGQAIKTPNGAGGTTNVIIENLQIDGNKANIAINGTPNEEFQCGIEFDEVTNGRIENVYVHDTVEDGIIVDNSSTRIIVTKNLVVNAGKSGGAATGRGIDANISSTDLEISKNIVVGSLGQGISLQSEGGSNTERWAIINNLVSNGSSQGIIVGDNTINASTPVDIYLRRGTIAGNTVVGNAGHGIRLFENTIANVNGKVGIMDSITVTGNTVVANAGDGIKVERSNDGSVCCITITGNTVKDNTTFGVLLQANVGDVVVVGNTLLNNGSGPFSNAANRSIIGGNKISQGAPAQGAFTIDTGIIINSTNGTPISSHFSQASACNFGVPGGVPGQVDIAVAMSNVALGDTVIVSPGVTLPVNYVLTGFVSSPGNVTMRMVQYAGAAAGQNLGNCRIDVWQH